MTDLYGIHYNNKSSIGPGHFHCINTNTMGSSKSTLLPLSRPNPISPSMCLYHLETYGCGHTFTITTLRCNNASNLADSKGEAARYIGRFCYHCTQARSIKWHNRFIRRRSVD